VIAALNAALAALLSSIRVGVRPETALDRDFCASLYALTRAAELASVDWSDDDKQFFCRQQFDTQYVHYRQHYANAQFLLIEVDGVSAGRLYFEKTGKELRLMEITLVDAVRNRGIGGAISRALLLNAHSAGIPMGLHVEPFNPARRLYERQGFREVETRGLYLYMTAKPPAV